VIWRIAEKIETKARAELAHSGKAAGLSWPTVKHICILRRKVFSPQAIENARHSFDRLQTTTTQWLERHAALADWHQLSQQIRAQESPARVS
jgi:hypothetical protein